MKEILLEIQNKFDFNYGSNNIFTAEVKYNLGLIFFKQGENLVQTEKKNEKNSINSLMQTKIKSKNY